MWKGQGRHLPFELKETRNRPFVGTLHTGKLLKNNHARPANEEKASRRPWFVHFYRDYPLRNGYLLINAPKRNKRIISKIPTAR